MLVELHLRNLAVAADVSLTLGPGLNVLTGSTGAGKSLVVQALRWLRGEEVDRSMLRAGCDIASAEAVFDLADRPALVARLGERGIEVPEDGFLRVRREVRREGRTRAFVGARTSSAATLAAIADDLLELQSQHAQLTLLDTQAHARLLDSLGVDESPTAYRSAYERWRAVESAIAEAESRAHHLREQRDLLEFQRRELVDAGLEAGEDEVLRQRVARLEGGARLMESAEAAREALDGEAGAHQSAARALHALRSIPEELDELISLREDLVSAADLLDECARGLSSFLEDRDFDSDSLARDQDRLGQLQILRRKYGRTEAELIALRDRLEQELGALDSTGGISARLVREREEAVADLQRAADALEKDRARVARRTESQSAPLLAELGMTSAALRFDRVADEDPDGPIRLAGRRVVPHAAGASKVRLSVRTNAGERFGPVEKVASGGELSRIGLVLRGLASARQRPALLVLDEVDAGLGADLGPALSRRLSALASASQLLVISHLPAVAAAADVHLLARKNERGERAASEILSLDHRQRVSELQRMLGGPHTESEALARELLLARGGAEASAFSPASPKSREGKA